MYTRGLSTRAGFTLIELLVVIAIIGILASVILASLNTARSKARDAQRKEALEELSKAVELYRNDHPNYPVTSGGFSNPNHGGLDASLTPTYITKISDDPTSNPDYQYWRKDYVGYSCLNLGPASIDRYAFYAKLENPSAADLATINDSFDNCIKTTWGYNYKIGN